MSDGDWIATVLMVVTSIKTVGYRENSQLPTPIQTLIVLVFVPVIPAFVSTFGTVCGVSLCDRRQPNSVSIPNRWEKFAWGML